MKDIAITRSAATQTLTALTTLLLAGSLAVSLAGCDATAHAQPAAPVAKTVDAQAALSQLASIPVKGRAPKTGYAREEFGAAWADVDHNG